MGCTAYSQPKESQGFWPQFCCIPWGSPCRGPSRGLACAELGRGGSSPFCEVGRALGAGGILSWLVLTPCSLASAMPSVLPVPTHLSHRHPLWRAALQENLVVQGYLLAQRLLVEVLAQIWEEGGDKAQSGG